LFFYIAHAAELLDDRVVGIHGGTITLLMDENHTILVRLALDAIKTTSTNVNTIFSKVDLASPWKSYEIALGMGGERR